MAVKPFEHYIVTRFNVGLYDPTTRKNPIFLPLDEWMQHRIKLFTTFTLPSIMGQTCQNFTWLVFMDEQTPGPYRQMLANIPYPNMHLIYISGNGLENQCIADATLRNIRPGDNDLITTRIDNDDAFRADVVEVIQNWYAPRPSPWTIAFPAGLILDLATKQIFVFTHWYNNCPTLIESAQKAKSVYWWPHCDIPVKVREYIVDKPYWLQVVHSKNVVNAMAQQSGSITIHKEIPAELSALSDFNVDVNNIMNLEV